MTKEKIQDFMMKVGDFWPSNDRVEFCCDIKQPAWFHTENDCALKCNSFYTKNDIVSFKFFGGDCALSRFESYRPSRI